MDLSKFSLEFLLVREVKLNREVKIMYKSKFVPQELYLIRNQQGSLKGSRREFWTVSNFHAQIRSSSRASVWAIWDRIEVARAHERMDRAREVLWGSARVGNDPLKRPLQKSFAIWKSLVLWKLLILGQSFLIEITHNKNPDFVHSPMN